MDGLSDRLLSILRDDPLRWHLLAVVAALDLPDCWIAAGFVRNAVWDHLHGFPPAAPDSDIDVIWFDPARTSPENDRRFEAELHQHEPTFAWSVKNQARMHIRNDDGPYLSATDAMRFWPETATAIAVRRSGNADCELSAPLGLDDLFAARLRPTSRFVSEKRAVFDQRLMAKNWLTRWPRLREC